MFDDNELEQIREERDDWQGHVDRQTVKRSRTSKKVLFGSMTASFVAVSFLVFVIASGMMASALIGAAGIGGFYADIGELEGDDIAIYPAVGPTAACESEDGYDFGDGGPGYQGDTGVTTLPQLRGEIGGATVPAGQTLSFIKDVQTPDIAPLDMFRIDITAEPETEDLELEQATLYLTALEAEELSIQDAQIREFFSDGDAGQNPRFWNGTGSVIDDGAAPGEFAIQNAEDGKANAQILNANARAHFIAFDQLDIPNLELEVEYFTDEADASDPEAVTADDNCPEW